MTIRDRRNSGEVRTSRPLSIEQLEARMMCTINDLQLGLNLLANPLPATKPAGAVTSNAAPVVSQPLSVTGLSNGAVTAKTVLLSAIGADDKGEKNLQYSWSISQAPTGAQVTFSANGNNAAKRSTLTFNKAGEYRIQLTIKDRDGASVTRLQNIIVAQTLTSLQVQSGGTIRHPSVALVVNGTETRLSVRGLDQFGAAMKSQTNIIWTAQSVGSGGKVSVSTVNNVNDSTTQLRFEKSGNYAIFVSTGKLKSQIIIKVPQTPSSVSVTPGTTELQYGAKQQFNAKALDQFGLPMSMQPKFAWAANGGTVNSTGLFSAAQSAGTYSVSAQTGSLISRATIKVTASGNANPSAPNSVLNEIKNVAIKNLTQTYFADGSITRPEMIQLLRSAGIDGSIDTTELTDLRYIVANASKFNIPAYVQVLASDVVNINPANGLYQGTALGNLTAGSSANQLNKLVDKWFLGTDRPTLTNSSNSYQKATGPLFVGLPTYTDQRQGMLGDCYFIAALGSLAMNNPTAIQNMFIDNGDGTYTIRFYGGTYGAFYNTDGSISDGFSNGVGIADYITVDRLLPALANGTLAYSNYGLSISSPNNALWIALAEKAYAQWNATGKSGRSGVNSYASIEGGWMSAVDAQVLGYNATRYSLTTPSNQQALIDALNAKAAVTTGTRSSGLTNGLVGSHAYTITGYNATNGMFTLYNPWGTTQPTPLTWAQMQSNLTQFVVANGSRSTPILSAFASVNIVRSQVESIAAPLSANIPSESELVDRACDHHAVSFETKPTAGVLEAPEINWSQVDDVPADTIATDARRVADVLFDLDQLESLFADLLS